MITILIDFQYKVSKYSSDRIFWKDLITSLSNNQDIKLLLPDTIEKTIEYLKSGVYDIFQATGVMDYYINYLSVDKKIVGYISNMIPELLYEKIDGDVKQVNQEIEWKTKQIFGADHIITTHKDNKNMVKLLYSRYKDINELVTVITPGIDLEYKQEWKKPISNDYILYIGERLSNINYTMFEETISKIAKIIENDDNLFFVMIGSPISDAEKSLFLKYNIYKKIAVFVDENNDKNLLKYSKCLLCSAIYDAFNANILEAFYSETPVLLNDSNKIYHEICEEYGCYYDIENLDYSLEQVLKLTKSERKEIVENQKKLLSKYDVKYTSDKLYKIYKRLTDEKA